MFAFLIVLVLSCLQSAVNVVSISSESMQVTNKRSICTYAYLCVCVVRLKRPFVWHEHIIIISLCHIALDGSMSTSGGFSGCDSSITTTEIMSTKDISVTSDCLPTPYPLQNTCTSNDLYSSASDKG